MDSKWIDKGDFWLSTAKQGSEEWKKLRRCRITGSRVGSFVNHSRFSSVDKSAREITGLLNPSFSEKSRLLMNNGITCEPHARNWYINYINKNIKEVGFAIPKWDSRLGVSVDGVIDKNTICEIKVPGKMYEPLIKHREDKKTKFPKNYHEHIWPTHYDQMQMGMVVMGAKKCHYIVYFPNEEDNTKPDDVYIEIVHFNKVYWEELYEIIKDNYNEHIDPLMKKFKIKRIDPPS